MVGRVSLRVFSCLFAYLGIYLVCFLKSQYYQEVLEAETLIYVQKALLPRTLSSAVRKRCDFSWAVTFHRPLTGIATGINCPWDELQSQFQSCSPARISPGLRKVLSESLSPERHGRVSVPCAVIRRCLPTRSWPCLPQHFCINQQTNTDF